MIDDNKKSPLLSVVVPIFNEQDCLLDLYRAVRSVLDLKGILFELILVDDGSSDRSLEIIKDLNRKDQRVRYASFSRNFGHEAASTCGLRMAEGDAVVLMDADLQDPPNVIPRMYDLWLQGYEVVYAHRKNREGEGTLKRVTAHLFYRILNAFSAIKIPVDVGDFRLADRKVVDSFNQLTERNRFVRGLFAWVGYRQTAIEYERLPRKNGKTKYNWLRLVLLSMDALFGFSLVPLRLCTIFGLLTVIFSFAQAGKIMFHKLFFGLNIPGYALMTTGMFFLGGVQLMFLGVIGEYIGKIFTESQGRPLYIIRESNDEHANMKDFGTRNLVANNRRGVYF